MNFESEFFKVSPEQIKKLQSKYCDNCEICKGSRVVIVEDKKQKCECVHKFNEEYQLIASNIPVAFRDATSQDVDKEFIKQNSENFKRVAEYSKKLPKALEKGFGLYIQGTTGGGKSFLATLILKRALREGYSGYFILLRDLINASFDALGDVNIRNDLERLVTDTDFLVIDELDKVFNDKNDVVRSLLEDLFKRRYYSKKPLIVTSNVSKSDIKTIHGDTISAIFDERLLEVTFVGNYRPQILNKLEQEFFGDE